MLVDEYVFSDGIANFHSEQLVIQLIICSTVFVLLLFMLTHCIVIPFQFGISNENVIVSEVEVAYHQAGLLCTN